MNDEINLINGFECTSVDNFDKEYKRALEDVKNKAPTTLELERFVKFSENIDKIVVLGDAPDSQQQQQENTMAIDGDEDIQMEESELFEIDPLTKGPIRDPVRNIRCNHVYDKASIHNAIRANKNIKCAYVGCSNKQPVLIAHLQDDPVLKAKLDQKYTQREENVMHAEEDIEEEEDSDDDDSSSSSDDD
jgi:SUMO ligase MMS21 Smc5/6 complex component